jgi:arylsulfatase A
LALLWLSSGCSQKTSETVELDEPGSPNIILIMVDDLGTEGIGCYGGDLVPTPRIDRLAAEGARFTAAHTTPLCTPTRVRLMTGRGGLRNYVDFATLAPEEATFATQLQAAGYATGITGKWQLSGRSISMGTSQPNGSTPSGAGFDTWCLWQVGARGSRYFDPLLDIDGEKTKLKGEYGPDVFKDWAKTFMGSERDQPFFLYYPMALPHDPFDGTPASAPAPAGETNAQRAQRHFQDMVAHIDKIVGELLDHAGDLGIADNTLVIFTTDNSHSGKVWLTTGGAPTFGSKEDPIEAGTHVPLIVRWPGQVAAQSEVHDLVDLMDLMPTVVEAGGGELPAGVTIDGVSLVPRLTLGQPLDRKALAFWYDPRPLGDESDPVRWARSATHKLYGDGRLVRITSGDSEVPAADIVQRALLEQALAELPKQRALGATK